jgi:hypothetical protein
MTEVETSMACTAVRPFRINVPKEELVDLIGPKNSCRLAKGLNACWDSLQLTPRLSPRR